MSQSTQAPQRAGDSLPAWLSAGILGLALGGGGTYLAMQNYVFNNNKAQAAPAPTMPAPGGMPGAPGGAGSMMGMPGGGMGGGGMGMGGGGMGMGGGGMGMGSGGGGGGGKRSLTQLVGKLELLSRPNLNLQVQLDEEQATRIAAKLAELENMEKMTADEAQDQLSALEELLSDEQKSTLGLVGLPPPARAGGGGPPGAGAPGAGGPPAAGGPPGMGGMGPPPDENPFTQEANQKRLKDLLGRLSPESGDKETPPEGAAKAEESANPDDSVKVEGDAEPDIAR